VAPEEQSRQKGELYFTRTGALVPRSGAPPRDITVRERK